MTGISVYSFDSESLSLITSVPYSVCGSALVLEDDRDRVAIKDRAPRRPK